MQRLLFSFFLIGFCSVFLLSNSFGQCAAMQPVNLGLDTTLCTGQTILLNAATTGPYNSYLWNNNSTSSIRLVNTAGTYWVKVTNLGTDLIVNGDFEQGNTNFTTSYSLGIGGPWGLVSDPGTYAIVNSPNAAHNNFTPCQDHTSGPGTQMLVVNGSGTANTNVWCQNINVSPNTDYQFGAWITNALSDPNVAQLQFSINSVNLGPIFSTSTVGCDWQQFFQTWNSGLNSSAQICINNQNTSGGGNDFVIDDITFRPICVDYDSVIVSYSAPPVVNLGTDQTICSNDSLQLNAQNPGMTYSWSTSATSQSIYVSAIGNYAVTVTNQFGCSASDNINLNTEQIKNAGGDSSAVVCETLGVFNLNQLLSSNATITETWIDPQNSFGANLTFIGLLSTAGLNGSFNVAYVVDGTSCPDDTSQFNIQINQQPIAAPSFNLTLCNTINEIVDLDNSIAGNTITNPPFWLETSLIPSSQFDAPTGQLNLGNLPGGNYEFAYVFPADSMCSSDTTFATVQITENPIIQFSANTVKGCVPLEVDFNNESITVPNSTFSWNLGDGTFASNPTSVNHTYTSAVCFDVSLTITANNLCTRTLTIPQMICVDPLPIAAFDFSPQQIFSIDPVVNFDNNSTTNAFNYWNFGDGFSSTETQPTHQYPLGEAQNYIVELIVVSDQGCSDTISKIITIKDQLLVFVPNTFTPDGNEFNNEFRPIITSGIDTESYELYIYNRWGQLVFESSDLAIGWDGNYQGKLVQEGIYTWVIYYKFEDSDAKEVLTGNITLLK
jgi:gliding motility-associated-like protein